MVIPPKTITIKLSIGKVLEIKEWLSTTEKKQKVRVTINMLQVVEYSKSFFLICFCLLMLAIMNFKYKHANKQFNINYLRPLPKK